MPPLLIGCGRIVVYRRLLLSGPRRSGLRKRWLLTAQMPAVRPIASTQAVRCTDSACRLVRRRRHGSASSRGCKRTRSLVSTDRLLPNVTARLIREISPSVETCGAVRTVTAEVAGTGNVWIFPCDVKSAVKRLANKKEEVALDFQTTSPAHQSAGSLC